MVFFLRPKEDIFFNLFVQSTKLVQQGSHILRDAMEDYPALDKKMELISALEDEADHLNDAIVDRLNQTFITPMDREDIYALATMMDDMVDFFQGIMERMLLYKTGQPSQAAIDLSLLLVEATEELVVIFEMIANIKGNQNQILDCTRKVEELESAGDRVYRSEIARLLVNCQDPVYIIKWKEVLSHMEDSLDHCERIANVIRGVVMKYA